MMKLWLSITLIILGILGVITEAVLVMISYRGLRARLDRRLEDLGNNRNTITSKFRIYSVKVDLLQTFKNDVRKQLSDKLASYEITLPYTCNYGTVSVPVVFDKLGIFTLEPTQDALDLQADIRSGAVRYLVVNDIAFMIIHHPDMEAVLHHDNPNRVFVLFVAPPNHKINGPGPKEARNCTFRMVPAFGALKKMQAPEFLIDLKSEVFPENAGASAVPCQIIGYGLS